MEEGVHAFDIINRQNTIIIFVEAVKDPVRREDRIKALTSKNCYENIFSKTSAEIISSEDSEVEEELNRPWVADTRLSKTRLAKFIFTIGSRE